MKEYLELDDRVIEDFISIFELEWYAAIANITTDTKAADVLETILGTPNWIKERNKSA